ncbi:three-helix bundle dimerization domain-containing protein [Modestobacter italicus]|uniref:three-helix bundle dimerization domain-containing protein n=1 Tax=Modestobacter italicus (strain DSM 44449 / CECT 9708 / BC 501) TaxID=2732864 RepID=UPI0014127DBA|nr:hypothetical protein [Modestobacter marinus]
MTASRWSAPPAGSSSGGGPAGAAPARTPLVVPTEVPPTTVLPRDEGAEGVPRPGGPVAARRDLLAGAHSVDERIRQLEQRLLAEAAGDPHRERDLQAHLAHARTRFASATVRQFLPILIEREVRRRIAGH